MKSSAVKRTNYFGRFENKSADAEDRLTRAFLVLLRLIPPVQAAFIDAIREKQRDQGKGALVPQRTSTDTGVDAVWSQIGDLRADEGRVLSILLTNREWDEEVEVQPSDRRPVYDGVVHYGEQWVFAIENKPYGDVREDQLHPNVEGSEGLAVDCRLVILVWKDLIRRLHALEESGWLDYTQRQLVDFLRYTQNEFPEINPYQTLAHCGNDLDKLDRHCEDLMQELAPDRVDTRQWGTYIHVPELEAAKAIIVSANEKNGSWEIDLGLYPGGTVSQSRSLYAQVEIGNLLALTDQWACSTNLHFAHMSKNLVYPSPEVSLSKYLEFWQEHQDWIRQVKEEKFNGLLDLLERNGLLTETDRDEFETEFMETNRSTVNACPGVSMHYRWPRTEALDLDRADRLTTQIDDRVREAVLTWGAEDAWSSVLNGRE